MSYSDRSWSPYRSPSRPFSYGPSSVSSDFPVGGRRSDRGSSPPTYPMRDVRSSNNSRHHNGTQRTASNNQRRRCKKFVCGACLSLISLVTYFSGGFLLVSYHRGVYPILNTAVQTDLLQ